MLHLTTVDTSAYLLLQEISGIEIIKNNFALAGGTLLALRTGHRKSIDQEFFYTTPFNVKELKVILSSTNQIKFDDAGNNSRILFGFINGIKCDFINEPATLLEPFVNKEGVNYFSMKDIAAMKLHTICGRGKKKDFFDVYTFLQPHSWKTMTDWFIKKYDEKQLLFLWRSILYFNDAEDDPEIEGYSPYNKSWKEIKEYITANCF